MTEKEVIYSLYVHTFPNGKVYVGITSKNNPKERWANGKGYLSLKNGKPTQYKMYNAIMKYGWNSVKSEVILQTKYKDEIEKQERYFITEVYHSNLDKFGYNIDLGGTFTGKFSKEKCKRMSNSLQGENNPQYGKHYWNNGIIQIVSKECPGDNFVLGSLPRSDEFKKHMKELANTPEIKYKKHIGMLNANISTRKWWNNGIEQKHCENCPGEGWVRGQLPISDNDKRKTNSYNKGKKLWNNGLNQIYANECPGKGWIRGALPLSNEKLKQKQEKRKNTCIKKYGVDNVNYLPQLINAHKNKSGKNNPNYGKVWWNNGIINVISKECPGEDFKRGMLPMPKEIVEAHKLKTKGNRYWTNGVQNKMAKECPGEGWYLGMTKINKSIEDTNNG